MSGTFTANGNEKYVILGNFTPTANVNKTVSNSAGLPTVFSDYCFDDVSLININLPAYAGPDLWCIPGDSVFIGRQPDVGIDEACMWYQLPNTTTPIDTVAGLWVKPNATTSYLVRQEICGNVKWDLVTVYESATGLQELGITDNQFNVYPNPAKNEIEIEFLNDNKVFTKPQELKIVDVLGREIKTFSLQNKKQTIDISELKSGCYYLQLETENKLKVNKKIIKE